MEKLTEIFKLNTPVTDSATGLEGMLTHLIIEVDGACHYQFQPRGINHETGKPVRSLWISPKRVVGGTLIPVPSRVPMEVLNTEAEDMASGFKGIVVALCLHSSGCFHATVQPKGVIERTGGAIEPVDFDLRRLKGPFIPVLTENQIEKDQEEKPSPGGTEHYPFF